jgi:hypothetical protein
MMADDFTELKWFLGAYFHQDWDMDASGPDEVVFLFLRHKPEANKINRIVDQIGRYVGTRKDESVIERGLYEELNCEYLPSADGMSAGDWLRHVAALLGNQQSQRAERM